ncbi:gag protein, partial [Lasius niger]
MHSEKFVDYAEEKLSLMQNLSLTEKEKIELLADGVKDSALRKLVLSMWVMNIPDFIDYVRRITKDSTLSRRSDSNTRLGGHSRFQNKSIGLQQRENVSTERNCFNCKQPDHISRDCKHKKPVCFKCGEEGHINPTCLKKGASANTRMSYVIEKQESESESNIASTSTATIHVSDLNSQTKDRASVKVQSLAIPGAILETLIDTGSY